MRDANEALESVRKSGGFAKLEFNSFGVAELIFDGRLSINLIKVDDTTVELVTYLDIKGFSVDIIPLRGLLHANYLGDATGPGRIALHPEDDTPLYCQRVNVTTVDAQQFERLLLDYAKYAAFWSSDAASSMLGPVPPAPSSILPAGEIFLRL